MHHLFVWLFDWLIGCTFSFSSSSMPLFVCVFEVCVCVCMCVFMSKRIYVVIVVGRQRFNSHIGDILFRGIKQGVADD